MPTRIAAIVLIVATAGLAGCGGVERAAGPGPSPTSGVIAIVGTDRITAAELDAVIAESRRSWVAENEEYPEPGSAKFLDLRRQAMELLIERSQLEQAAAARGVDVSPEAIDEELAATRRDQSENLAAGRTDGHLRADIREHLLWYEAYRSVAAEVPASDRARGEAWLRWTRSVETDYVATWFAPGFDPADLPRNVRRHPRPTNQRPYTECDLDDRSYDYGELVELGCAGDVAYDPGPGDLLCPDLFRQSSGVGSGFTSEQMESGYSEAQMYVADRKPSCWTELGPHSVSILLGGPRVGVPHLP